MAERQTPSQQYGFRNVEKNMADRRRDRRSPRSPETATRPHSVRSAMRARCQPHAAGHEEHSISDVIAQVPIIIASKYSPRLTAFDNTSRIRRDLRSL